MALPVKTIIAWAKVNADGSIAASKGISGVSNVSTISVDSKATGDPSLALTLALRLKEPAPRDNVSSTASRIRLRRH